MTVFKHRAPLLSGLLALTLLGSNSALADAAYPSQAITFVVPYAAVVAPTPARVCCCSKNE